MNARNVCRSYDGDLVSVANKDESDFLIKHADAHHDEYFWIGLNDRSHENKFVWSDGTPFSSSVFNNWGRGEPNNHLGEHCANLQNDVWNDVICTNKLGYICERQKGRPLSAYYSCCNLYLILANLLPNKLWKI